MNTEGLVTRRITSFIEDTIPLWASFKERVLTSSEWMKGVGEEGAAADFPPTPPYSEHHLNSCFAT
ncbi:hypothetical protein E2C01_002326 [Portunus trituberculatus]|uniref:Uncharacterized protein n=1 Tax=Portunus trituberculatus TaxID=210409 RepID=A0A5B7CJF3_PORTR|nr:hypothetical protein [Portunus trituberculatus]